MTSLLYTPRTLTTFSLRPPTNTAIPRQAQHRAITRGPYDRIARPVGSRQCSPSPPDGGGPMRPIHGILSAAAFNRHRRRSSMPTVGSLGMAEGFERERFLSPLDVWRSFRVTPLDDATLRRSVNAPLDLVQQGSVPAKRRSSTPCIPSILPSPTFPTAEANSPILNTAGS